jgi:hypothetical protein
VNEAFLDTSVLVATLCGDHQHQDASFQVFRQQKIMVMSTFPNPHGVFTRQRRPLPELAARLR